MAVSKRGGIGTSQALPHDIKTVIEPMLDILRRITGTTGTKLTNMKRLEAVPIAALGAGAPLAPDTIAKVNELVTRVNLIAEELDLLITDENAIKSRLQED